MISDWRRSTAGTFAGWDSMSAKRSIRASICAPRRPYCSRDGRERGAVDGAARGYGRPFRSITVGGSTVAPAGATAPRSSVVRKRHCGPGRSFPPSPAAGWCCGIRRPRCEPAAVRDTMGGPRNGTRRGRPQDRPEVRSRRVPQVLRPLGPLRAPVDGANSRRYPAATSRWHARGVARPDGSRLREPVRALARA